MEGRIAAGRGWGRGYFACFIRRLFGDDAVDGAEGDVNFRVVGLVDLERHAVEVASHVGDHGVDAADRDHAVVFLEAFQERLVLLLAAFLRPPDQHVKKRPMAKAGTRASNTAKPLGQPG